MKSVKIAIEIALVASLFAAPCLSQDDESPSRRRQEPALQDPPQQDPPQQDPPQQDPPQQDPPQQDPPQLDPPQLATARQWVKDHGIPLGTPSPGESDDFADLEPLSNHLAGVRMVMLGEPTHGDGAAFDAKRRLIRYLHQRQGFDVLAWQSGTFDCEIMRRELANSNRNTDSAASFGVYSVWGASSQVLPIFDYARGSLDSERPLTLCGFDCVVTARGGEQLPTEILNRIPAGGPELLTRTQKSAFREAHRRLLLPPYVAVGSQIKRDQQALADVRAMLLRDGAADRLSLTADEVATLVVSLDNFSTESRMRVLMQSKDTLLDAQNLRQSQLGKNLVWLAQERYPDRKIIVWCTNQDMLRDLKSVEPNGDADDFSQFQAFGATVHEALGDEMLSIGFTAFGGRHGIVAHEQADLAPSPKDSIEAIAMEAGEWDELFIDLRSARGDDSPLATPLFARPIGYTPFRATWSHQLDALYVIREMTPSTFRDS